MPDEPMPAGSAPVATEPVVGTGPPPSGGTPPAADWRTGLPPELAGHKTIQTTKDVTGLARQLVDAQDLIGRSIQIPKTAEDLDGWRRVYQKLGWPDKPDGYTITPPKLPEGVSFDETALAAFRGLAHAHGLNQRQVQAIVDWYGQRLSAEFPARDALRQEAEQTLKGAWGGAYDRQTQVAARAILHLGGDRLRQVLDETGAGDIPELVMAFAKIGDMLVEDGVVSGQGIPTVTDAQARINAIRNDPKHAYHDARAIGHKEAVAEVQKLYELIYRR